MTWRPADWPKLKQEFMDDRGLLSPYYYIEASASAIIEALKAKGIRCFYPATAPHPPGGWPGINQRGTLIFLTDDEDSESKGG